MRLPSVLVAVALLAGCSAQPWTREDTIREGAYDVLLYIDYRQTKSAVVERPGTYYEANPVLGAHPSEVELRNAVVASAVGHAAVAAVIPSPWRETWQYFFIGGELYAVGHNYSIGLRFPF